jgi:hypothetical protein
MWLASNVPGMRRRQVLRQRAGQRVTREMASAETGGGRLAPAGDELNSGGRTVTSTRPVRGSWRSHPDGMYSRFAWLWLGN